MSDRLAHALLANVAEASEAGGDPTLAWLLIEGVEPSLASRLVDLWPEQLPPIFVAGPQDVDFGEADLRAGSATRARNRGGMCLVVCEGERVPDGQSVVAFDRCGPETLLGSSGFLRLAAQPPSVATEPGISAVAEAVADEKLESPPSARAVASFLDQVAAGESASDALPAVGGFREDLEPGSLTAPRVVANLNLAVGRSTAERLAPSSLSDIRERAERHLNPEAAERVVELLLARDEALLHELSFRDASAVLERPPAAGLPQRVASEFADFGESTPEAASDVARGIELGSQLENPEQRKEAAQELLDLDAQHQNGILSQDSRRRLKSQRRDRSVREESLEAGLIRALDNLSSAVKSVDLRDPQPPAGQGGDAALKAAITIAAAHVRIAPLLRRLEANHGVRVATALLANPGPQLAGALAQLESKGAPTHRALKIAVRGVERGDTVEVNWVPAAEDIALLAATARFAAADPPTLSLTNSPSRTLTLTSLTPNVTPPALTGLAARARATASAVLRDGYNPEPLRSWVADWRRAVEEQRSAGNTGPTLDGLTLAGAVAGASTQVALTAISPLKAEWLAQRTEAWWELVDLAASATSGEPGRSPGDLLPPPLVSTARALGAATASRYPGYVALSGREAPLLPASDASVFAVFGQGDLGAAVAELPLEPIRATMRKLIDLHPEAGDNLRCAAWGDRACDLLARALLSDRSTAFRAADLYCIEGRPTAETLADLDDRARADSGRTIQLRYIDELRAWHAEHPEPIAHLALLEGVTSATAPVRSNMEEIEAPPPEEDVLFTPRTWVRAQRSRVLLAPPRMSAAGKAWHALQSAVTESEWPSQHAPRFRVPELRADATGAGSALTRLHDLALWVATIDRYATRDTIRQAAGGDIAILHQERRAAGDAVFGLVISQRSGGTADRAISRSLRASNLLDETAADGVAKGLREAASRGYGILALRAATTGSGINELIGHVAAFHRLTSDATPWPLPPGCRVLLISLDEYASWFGTGKRADLLALALSPEEGGVHAANIEVKAVKDPGGAARSALVEAKEQLRKTLIDSRFAAYPNGSLFSRLWLNRIVEAAIGVCRENNLKLDSDDLVALDNFRLGDGVLEWAGVAMVFTPGAIEPVQHSHIPLMQDRVPIVQAMVPLTQELLAAAAASDGTQLRTVASGRSVLASSTKRRSFDRAMQPPQDVGGTPDPPGPDSIRLADASPPEPAVEHAEQEPATEQPGSPTNLRVEVAEESPAPDSPPILGWDGASGEPVEWRVTGAGALSNGHVEIYGTSGAGKTQFVMSLLAQLKSMGSHFGVCDFKNDYAADFPDRVGARFFDLWAESLPFNPLAIDDPSRRNLQALTIELRDAVDIAARAYARLGHRQLTKLQQAFEEAFEEARTTGKRAPTLRHVHELLDDDLRGVIGDLTGTDLFGDGPPLGSVVDHDVVFGLNRIPGTGMTTTLAAGFILAALYLKLLEMPQVANQVTYTMVIDEAHRVGHFHSVSSMVRELRSKGLAVILATQKPGDLPDEASTNAQTKIFLRLPDAQSARDAAKALDPLDRGLPELIRTLPNGEAFVGFAGAAPRLIRLKQFWRDH